MIELLKQGVPEKKKWCPSVAAKVPTAVLTFSVRTIWKNQEGRWVRPWCRWEERTA